MMCTYLIPWLQSVGTRHTLSFEFEVEEEEVLVLELSGSNFDEPVQRYPLFLADCCAEWHALCRMVAHVIQQLAEYQRGRIGLANLMQIMIARWRRATALCPYFLC